MVLDQVFLLGHVEYVCPYKYWAVMGTWQPEPWCRTQGRRQDGVIEAIFVLSVRQS